MNKIRSNYILIDRYLDKEEISSKEKDIIDNLLKDKKYKDYYESSLLVKKYFNEKKEINTYGFDTKLMSIIKEKEKKYNIDNKRYNFSISFISILFSLIFIILSVLTLNYRADYSLLSYQNLLMDVDRYNVEIFYNEMRE